MKENLERMNNQRPFTPKDTTEGWEERFDDELGWLENIPAIKSFIAKTIERIEEKNAIRCADHRKMAIESERERTLQDLRDVVAGDDDATDTLEEIIKALK